MSQAIDRLFAKLETLAILAVGHLETKRIAGTGGTLTKAIRIAEVLPVENFSKASVYTPFESRANFSVATPQPQATKGQLTENPPNKNKPAVGSTTAAQFEAAPVTMTLIEFNKLSPGAKMAFCKAGNRILS